MILNYSRPQLTISDNIEVVTSTLANRFQTLIVGPQYRLHRYGSDVLGNGATILAAGQTLNLHYQDANGITQPLPLTDVVDTTSLAVYAVGAEISLAVFTGSSAEKVYLASTATPNILYITAGIYSATKEIWAGSGANVTAFYTRPAQVGDIVVITDGGTTRRRTVVALASSTGSTSAFDQVVLNGPAVDVSGLSDNHTAIVAEFRIPYTGTIPSGDYTFNIGGPSVTVAAAPTGYVPSRSTGHTAVVLADQVGIFHVSYRSLVPPATATEDMIEITSTADINTYFGSIDIANDIAYGASRALVGSQGRPIYALRVAGIDNASFSAALAKMESTDQVYAFGIMTSDLAVMQVAATHAAAMCQPDIKNWRRIYVGTDSPGSYTVQSGHICTVSGSTGVPLVTLSNDPTSDFFIAGVQPGDIADIGGVNYTIATIINNKEITLVSPGPATGSGLSINLIRADTVASQSDFVNARSEALDSDLVSHIWVENGSSYIGTTPTLIPSRYVAAEIAGLRSALMPQQGLTHTEISTVTSAPAMYLRYRQTDLDAIAANGAFIVTQDNANGPVYIRHQLTTDTSQGSLYYEDSCPTILHALDFQAKDLLVGYIGVKNATPQVVSQIENAMHDLLTAATLTTDTNIGPLIIAFSALTVGLHPILKDRIVVTAVVTIPLPLNNIDVTFNAEVSV
jgi:hypothetical protein